MKTEELIKELKLSIHDGINVLDPLAKEMLREYKMQQLTYAVIFGILTIILGIVIYKMAKRYLRQVDEGSYWDVELPEFLAYTFVPIGFIISIFCTITSITSYVSPVISLIQSFTGK